MTVTYNIESARRDPYFDQFGGFDDYVEKYSSAKQVAHAWQLSGIHYINGAPLNLEGVRTVSFREIFHKSLQDFSASHPDLIDSKEAALLCSFLDERADRNNAEEQSSSLLFKEFKKGNPVSLSSGFKGHRVIIAFYGDYLLIGNKGAATRRPIELYKINPGKLTAALFQEILDLEGKPIGAYEQWYNSLMQTLDATKDDLSLCIEQAYPLSSYQQVGNCTWESLQTCLYGFFLLNRLKSALSQKTQLIATSNKVFRSWQEFLQLQSLERFVLAYSVNPNLLGSAAFKNIDPSTLRGIFRQFWSTRPVSLLFKKNMEIVESEYLKTLQGSALLWAKIERQCYLPLRHIPYFLRDLADIWMPPLLSTAAVYLEQPPLVPFFDATLDAIRKVLLPPLYCRSIIKTIPLVRRHLAI